VNRKCFHTIFVTLLDAQRSTLKRDLLPGQVADLPISVKFLRDDPFRTLALYVRQVPPLEPQLSTPNVISHSVLIKWFLNVNSPTKPST
jgi:hypothetical protein